MFSLPFLKYTIKLNYKIWLVFTGILSFCVIFLITVLSFDKFGEIVPMKLPELNEAMATGLYGSSFILFPLIYEIMIGNRLIAKQIENGNMAYYMATQTSRGKIASTQSYFFILSVFLMFLWTSILGLVCCKLWGRNDLEISTFLMLNIGVFCLHVCISGICFLASCCSSDTKISLAIGAGLPILFYVIYILEAFSDTGILKFLTIFSLFNAEQIAAGSIHVRWSLPVLAFLGILLHSAGVRLFRNRDLPL